MCDVFWLMARFGAANVLVYISTFWLLKNAKNLMLFGYRFSSLETFWMAYVIALTPLWWVVNYLFLSAYGHGYYVIFPNRAWLVQIVVWAISLVFMFLTALFYLKELPTRNTLIAVFCLGGALCAILFDNRQP